MATDVIRKAAFGFEFGLSKPSHQHDHKQIESFIRQHIYSTTTLKMDLSGSFSIILGLHLPILQEPFRQILKRILYTMDWKINRTNKSLSSQLDNIVHGKMKDKDSRGSKDFLSLILNARESESGLKNVSTPDYISSLAYEHLLAGSATTTFKLSSVVYLVSGHPEVEKKLLEEIDAFGPHDQVPTANDLQSRFPYLDQVVKESMRFYTVSPLVARETSTQVTKPLWAGIRTIDLELTMLSPTMRSGTPMMLGFRISTLFKKLSKRWQRTHQLTPKERKVIHVGKLCMARTELWMQYVN